VVQVLSVQRLSANARLDDSPEALAHAKTEASAGDESWEQWLAEYECGDALIVRLELTIEITGGEPERLRSHTGGFFVENTADPPKLEQQIAEVASGDLQSLAQELARHAHPLEAKELDQMYVHVELDDAVLGRLAARSKR
jgi:hypothetical protein